MATPRLTPEQIAQVSDLVAQYIATQRERYASRAIPLSAQQRAAMDGICVRELTLRGVELSDLFLLAIFDLETRDRIPPRLRHQ